MNPLGLLRNDSDREYRSARQWWEQYPEASSVRIGRWEALLRIAHQAADYKEMYRLLETYLHHAPDRRDGNRWERPRLTAALLAGINEAATIDQAELPAATDGYLKSLSGAERARLVGGVSAARARKFLGVLVQLLKTSNAQG